MSESQRPVLVSLRKPKTRQSRGEAMKESNRSKSTMGDMQAQNVGTLVTLHITDKGVQQSKAAVLEKRTSPQDEEATVAAHDRLDVRVPVKLAHALLLLQ